MTGPAGGKKRWWLAASLGISGALVILLYLKTGVRLERLLLEWRQADPLLIGAAMLLSTLIHVLTGGHKLWLLLRWLGVAIPLRELFLVRLGEGPLRLVIPFKGGDLGAALFFHRRAGIPPGEAAGVILFDRALNLFGTSAWLLLGLVLAPGLLPGGRAVVGGVLAAGLLVLLLKPLHLGIAQLIGKLAPPRVSRVITGVLAPWRTLSSGARVLLLAYTLVFVSRPILLCALTLAAFQVSLPSAHLMVYTNLALFAGLIPGPLMGIGPREATLNELLSSALPEGSGVGLSVAFLLTAAMYLVPLLVGLPLVPWFLRRLVGGPGHDERGGKDSRALV